MKPSTSCGVSASEAMSAASAAPLVTTLSNSIWPTLRCSKIALIALRLAISLLYRISRSQAWNQPDHRIQLIDDSFPLDVPVAGTSSDDRNDEVLMADGAQLNCEGVQDSGFFRQNRRIEATPEGAASAAPRELL